MYHIFVEWRPNLQEGQQEVGTGAILEVSSLVTDRLLRGENWGSAGGLREVQKIFDGKRACAGDRRQGIASTHVSQTATKAVPPLLPRAREAEYAHPEPISRRVRVG